MVRRRERRHLVSIPRMLEKEQLDLFRNLVRTQDTSPFVDQFGKHAVGPAFRYFAQATKDRELVVGHAHVGLQRR